MRSSSISSGVALDAMEFGREMFEATADVSQLPAEQLVARDAKEYKTVGDRTICIAQIETVGKALLDRQDALLDAMEAARRSGGHQLFALMVTDILSNGTHLLVVGDRGLVERVRRAHDRRRARVARGDEPQEAGRPQAAGGALRTASVRDRSQRGRPRCELAGVGKALSLIPTLALIPTLPLIPRPSNGLVEVVDFAVAFVRPEGVAHG